MAWGSRQNNSSLVDISAGLLLLFIRPVDEFD